MSFRRFFIVIAVSIVLAGCVETPQSAALHVGMTKAEAIAAMGQPKSVSAQGGLEYLNYSISETSPSGYSTLTRPYYVRLVDSRVEAFGFSDQINRTLPSALSAANSHPRSDALKIGMTKEEAIAAMGSPASVSAEGSYQYLNYTVSDTSSSGMSTMMRPYYVRLVDGRVEAFGFSNQINRLTFTPAAVSGTRNDAAAAVDAVSVVGVEPATLVPGKRQSVAIKVRYSLKTRPKAVLDVLFNLTEAGSFRRVPHGEEVVSSGDGEVVLNVAITPVDWGATGPFKLAAHLLDYPRVPGRPPFAFSEQPVALAK